MRSIRARFNLLIIVAIIASVLMTGLFGILSIRNVGNRFSDENLKLICENETMALKAYLNSVEQSVETVSRFAEGHMTGLTDGELHEHLEKVNEVFESIAGNTRGALTYYYRINPEVSEIEKGYWYSSLDGGNYKQEELTDIAAYDPSDISRVGWFFVPKARGIPSWVGPYMNENLGTRMISYVAPVYLDSRFVGVIGMDIDYETLVEGVRGVRVLKSGYVFLTGSFGELIYHPDLNIEAYNSISQIEDLEGFAGAAGMLFNYTYRGVKKRAARSPLPNGMMLYVTAPVSEINAAWTGLIVTILFCSVGILLVFIMAGTVFSARITAPLARLAEAAKEMGAGNYEVELDYRGQDEVGILTEAFKQLTDHLKVYITDLNSRAYSDGLTHVRNKSAFSIYLRKLQTDIENTPEHEDHSFSVCMFDCNNLKMVNDTFGHEKGDIYLINACRLICDIWRHSPVFRIGGDEFAAILTGEDYQNREELERQFFRRAEEISSGTENPWEQISTALGRADYDPATDRQAEDVVARADRLMYEKKREMKKAMGTEIR